MPERAKKRPSWLTGEGRAEEPAPRRPGIGRKGPLAESGTDELRPVGEASAAQGPHDGDKGAVPRVTLPEPGAGKPGAGPVGILGRVRANPAPAVIALGVLLALAPLVYFVFFRDGEERPGARDGAGADLPAQQPFAGGPVRDTGVAFGALRERDGEVELDGAGLSWSGTVTEKEGGAGETVTLEGPTAAQLERGFDLGPSSVETGVYAVAREGGEVLHVATHAFVTEDGSAGEELTLGTVYGVRDGELSGYAYYLDEREPGSDRVTRTYVRPGAGTYSVSFEAEPGAFVPLLVGWRGFDDREEG